ncbi:MULTISPECIES: gluconate 2-dehydrogenase subunit 3 family protein [Sporosarcina]|uniref:Gluconate 2-dehydrogenase subunit 3 family protein n=1 Tax=Sporosarcina saromensis TaxID=359365 RepID=A0ABU4GE24_9BACL|nr:gluconate 2-dehydrogenase subunit 3 family protein [Sporosarcina saromensis]MDW0114578.1 gluconate 2-dehydrogenase subunit 3 family protein [Sporosarcina saromensis]
MADNPKGVQDKKGMSRRTFMKNTGLVAGGVVGGGLFGSLLTNQLQDKPAVQSTQENGLIQDARVFFSRGQDFDILAAATERIFPKDDLGPGAIELGIPYFIDKQLSTEWGINAKEYMKGPFAVYTTNTGTHNNSRNQSQQGPNAETQVPAPTPRYQTKMTRSEIFVTGLREMDNVAQKEFGASFVKLTGEQQDEVLRMFDEGKVDLKGIGSKNFFNMLLQTTLEGAYADPVYGGNKNMMGWKMKEYPGPRASYMAQIEVDEFVKLEPQSLRNYQGH